MLVFERRGEALILIGRFTPEKVMHLGDRGFIAITSDLEGAPSSTQQLEVQPIERPGIDEPGYPIMAVILAGGQDAAILPGWQARPDWSQQHPGLSFSLR